MPKPTLNEADLKLLETRFPTHKVLDKKFKDQEEKIGRRLENKLKEQEEKFERKLTQFKSEFFEKIDPILKEVLASREERSIIAHHISDLRTRVEKIEKHLGFAA